MSYHPPASLRRSPTLLVLLALWAPSVWAETIPPLEMKGGGELSETAASDVGPIPVLPLTKGKLPQRQTEPVTDADHPMGMHHFGYNTTQPTTKPATNVLQKTAPLQEQPVKAATVAPSPLSSPMAEAPPTATEPKIYTPLTAKQALIAPDKLRPWANLAQTALATTKDDAINVMKAIEANRGAVPPQALFLAAKALADNNLMDEAGVYYLVGQLRLSFDAVRWPAYTLEKPQKNKNNEDKKSSDQRMPGQKEATTTTPMINPQAGVASLGSMIGQPIVKWLLRHPENFEKDLSAAMAWDISAPYAYDTGYDNIHALAYDRWEEALNTSRQNFIGAMKGSLQNIKKIGMPKN